MFPPKYWREKYELDWCHQCDTASIKCPACGNSSCSGGGFQKCYDDFVDFGKVYSHPFNEMSVEEWKIYDKGLRIQRYILKSIEFGDLRIEWKKMNELGEMSKHDEEVFAKELE